MNNPVLGFCTRLLIRVIFFLHSGVWYVYFHNEIVKKEWNLIILYLQGWVLSSPDESMHLPAPNKFIPTDLSLKIVQEKVCHIFHFYMVFTMILSMINLSKFLIF